MVEGKEEFTKDNMQADEANEHHCSEESFTSLDLLTPNSWCEYVDCQR